MRSRVRYRTRLKCRRAGTICPAQSSSMTVRSAAASSGTSCSFTLSFLELRQFSTSAIEMQTFSAGGAFAVQSVVPSGYESQRRFVARSDCRHDATFRMFNVDLGNGRGNIEFGRGLFRLPANRVCVNTARRSISISAIATSSREGSSSMISCCRREVRNVILPELSPAKPRILSRSGD